MLKIAITGATGFIGRSLLKHLEGKDGIEVIALSRKISPQMDSAKKRNIIWRRCDGFSLLDVEKATEGADILVYLIHSMLPSTALAQGSFRDFDLYLADNFSRAAKKNGVKKIIYLSGIIPSGTNLSEHLESRLEVEKALSQYGNSLTVLRAGLIIGTDGSSFRILEKLIKRLPILICPAWTLTKTQPIDLIDVLATLNYCIEHYTDLERVYDIGGPDILSYKVMLKLTAEALGKRPAIINVPFFSPQLSKLWVSKVSTTPANLVYPLVDSLKHEMIVDKNKQLILPNHTYTNFVTSLKNGLSSDSEGWARTIINYNSEINFRWMENVTSIQRVGRIENVDIENISREYFNWLENFLKPLINIHINDQVVSFKFFNKILLLKLEKSLERISSNRRVFYVTGGVLARSITLNGRIEFRHIYSSKAIIIALIGFRPSLPWFVYKYTQAMIHLFIMRRFKRHLERYFRGNT